MRVNVAAIRASAIAEADRFGATCRKSIDFHNHMLSFMVAMAAGQGFSGKAECLVSVPARNGRARASRVDVGWFSGSSMVLACEVESSTRGKSIDKLMACPCEAKIYLFYGKKRDKLLSALAGYPSVVPVIIDKRMIFYT